MKGILLFFLCVYVVAVSCYTCDHNVTSIAHYQTLNQATFGLSTTICWAPGVYTYSTLTLSGNQTWIGPQADVDPTCGRLVNPPCDRLVSASSHNATVEAVFQSTSIYVTATGAFTMNGFTVVDGGSFGYVFYGVSPPLFLFNNYWDFPSSNNGVNGEDITFTNNYVKGSSSSTVLSYGLLDSSVYIGYNFFYNMYNVLNVNSVKPKLIFEHNSVILGNICVDGEKSFIANANFIVGCTSYAFQDETTASFYRNNVLLYNQKSILFQTSGVYTGKISNNCFADETISLDLFGLTLSNLTDINNNYWGDKTGPNFEIGYSFNTDQSGRGVVLSAPDNSFLSSFQFEPSPVKVPSPYICPGHMINISVEPHTLKAGYNTTIHWSFTINPQLIALGVTSDLFSNTQLTFTIGSIPNDIHFGKGSALSCNPTINFISGDLSVNGSCVVYVNMNNLPYGLNPTNNYTLIATASPTTALPYFTSIAHTPINVIPALPLGCWKNLTQTLNVPKVLQLNGPVHLTLANFSCNEPGFHIQSLASNSLNAVLESGTIVFTIAQEGVYVLSLTLSPDNQGDATYTGQATLNVEIDNHAPIAGSPNITYPKTRTTPLPSWNVLDYCSDQDGDQLTVLQIQSTKGWSSSDIQQLSPLQMYFVTEKVVVTVSSQGNITLSTPVINGNNVTPGNNVATSWHQNVAFQYQISDGDRKNSNAWGIIRISHS